MNAELLARNLAAHWVQSGLLAVAVLAAMRLLRVAEPRLRLAVLHLTLAATLLLPLVQPRRPADLPAYTGAVRVSLGDAGIRLLNTAAEPAPRPRVEPASAAVAVFVAGIVLRLLWLCGGIIRLRRFRARAREIPAPEVARDLEAVLGVSPRYFEHAGQGSPSTFGILGAAVVLPPAFNALDVSMQRAVACHELLHVKRRDAAMAAVEEFVAAVLWFHPWVWVLRLRIRGAREQIVDRQVVELVGNREAYVRCLVEISGHDLVPYLSTGMSSSRELRARIDAVLKEGAVSRRNAVAAGFVLVGVVAATGSLAAWAVPLRATPLTHTMSDPDPVSDMASLFSRTAAGPGVGRPPTIVSGLRVAPIASAAAQSTAQARQTAPSSASRKQINKAYAEYPQDALEKRIAGTVFVDIVVNPAGDVTTGAVASGPQELRSSAFKAALGLKFDQGAETTPLRVGVEYSLTADAWGVRVSIFDPSAGPRTDSLMHRAIDALDRETPLEGLRIGGAVQPPKKIRDVPPVYPPNAQAERVQGVVILEVRVDENGNISDTRVLRSIPILDQAAVDAVRQWQYTPTLLNGIAVPVVMTVTMNFSLRDLFDFEIILQDGNRRTSLYPGGTIVLGRLQLRTSRERDSTDVTVSIFGEDGQVHLGDVVLELGGPVVQLPTTPPMGLRLAAIR